VRHATVFADDAAVVRRVNREENVPRECIPAFIRVRALMNQLGKASVRYVAPSQNREAGRLADAVARNEAVTELPMVETLSLFPALTE